MDMSFVLLKYPSTRYGITNDSRQVPLEMKLQRSGVLIAKATFERWSYSYLSGCFFGIISFNGKTLRVFLFVMEKKSLFVKLETTIGSNTLVLPYFDILEHFKK